MPFNNKPDNVRPGQRRISASALNQIKNQILRQVRGGGGASVKYFGDRMVVSGLNTGAAYQEGEFALVAVIAEYDDWLLCYPLNMGQMSNGAQGPEYGAPPGLYDDQISSVPGDNMIYVAKPHSLQRTPWEGQTVMVDGISTTYSYPGTNSTNVFPVVMDHDPGERTATPAAGSAYAERVYPSYKIGEPLIVRRATTGYKDPSQYVNGVSDPADPLVYQDINEAGRSWLAEADTGINVRLLSGAPYDFNNIVSLQFDQTDGFGVSLVTPTSVRVDWSSTYTAEESDGAPAYTAVTGFIVDVQDGFILSQVGSKVRIDLADASFTQRGIVSLTQQVMGDGDKWFADRIGWGSIPDSGPSSLPFTGSGIGQGVAFYQNISGTWYNAVIGASAVFMGGEGMQDPFGGPFTWGVVFYGNSATYGGRWPQVWGEGVHLVSGNIIGLSVRQSGNWGVYSWTSSQGTTPSGYHPGRFGVVDGDGVEQIGKYEQVLTCAPGPGGVTAFYLEFKGGLYVGTSAAPGGGSVISIGTPVGSSTPGSVLYIDGSGNLAQNNANFFWDETNNRLGVGTNAPAAKIHASTNAAGEIGFIVGLAASQTANAMEVRDSGGNPLAGFSENGYPFSRKTAAPADAELSNDESQGPFLITSSPTRLGFKAKNASGTAFLFYLHLNKLDATAAPTVNDDGNSGYSVGSKWIDVTNDKAYICLDATAGAAVWTEITSTGSGITDGDKGDITVSGTGTVWTIGAGVVTHVKYQDIAGVSVIGRAANTAGVVDAITAASNNVVLRRTADTLNFGLILGTMVTAGTLDNTKLTDMPQATIKGRQAAAGMGVPEDLTAAQVITILTAADGTGSGLDADLLDGQHASAFQPIDADLTAIAALTGTNTIYYRSAANTWTAVTIGTGLDFTSGTLSNTVTGYNDEMAQDAVFAMTIDTPTINVTYTDATPEMRWDLVADSVTAGYLHATATSILFGRYTTGAGAGEQITLGSGLSLSGGGVLSATGSGGTVTSFSAGNLAPLFTTSVATATTTPALSFTLSNQDARKVFIGPDGGAAAAPTFRLLVAADIPDLSATYALAGHNHDAAYQPLDADLTAIAALTGTNTIYYRSAANTWSAVTIGTGLDFTSGTLSATSSGGTVTSFSAGDLAPLFTTSEANPTTTPALSFTLNTQVANRVFAGPTTGADAAPTFRLLVAADIPDLSAVYSPVGHNHNGVYQPLDATLTAFAALTIAANSLTVGTGADAFSQVSFGANTFPARASTGDLAAKTITDFGLSLVDDADAAAGRATLGLVIGTNVQAWDADLDALAALSGTNTIYYRSAANTWSAVTIGTGLNFASGTLSSTVTQYTDEMTQDAVFAMTVDTNTVNVTYTDATPEMKWDVIYQMSITADASGIKLVGDATSPGNSKYYGTDGSGTKGYHAFPAAAAHALLSASHSDTTAAAVQRGDLITGQGASATWTRLAKGTAGQKLESNGTDLLFQGVTDKTLTDLAFGDEFELWDVSVPASRKATIERLGGIINPTINNYRLTLQNAVTVPDSDRTAATTLYLYPHNGNRICIHDGTRWVEYSTASGTSLSLASLSANTDYDIFVYYSGGSLVLEAVAFDLTKSLQDGIEVKDADATRRYVGSIRTVAAGQGEDSVCRRFVWNTCNKVQRILLCQPDDQSHTYTTATWRPWNNVTTTSATGTRIELIVGLANISPVVIHGHHNVWNNNTGWAFTGLGLNSTTVNQAQLRGGFFQQSMFRWQRALLGHNYLQFLQISQATGTSTWYGTGALGWSADANPQSGMMGYVMG